MSAVLRLPQAGHENIVTAIGADTPKYPRSARGESDRGRRLKQRNGGRCMCLWVCHMPYAWHGSNYKSEGYSGIVRMPQEVVILSQP
jgi:hypothetical protein